MAVVKSKTKDATPKAVASDAKPWETETGEPSGEDSQAGSEGKTLLEKNDEIIEEAKALILEKSEKVEEVVSEKVEEVVDLVVALASKPFAIAHPDGTKTHFIAGTNTVSRDDAEHWYAKAQGVQIIGVPDIASIKSVTSQESYASLKTDLENLGKKIFALTELKDLTAEQNTALRDALSFVGQADEAIEDFLESLK